MSSELYRKAISWNGGLSLPRTRSESDVVVVVVVVFGFFFFFFGRMVRNSHIIATDSTFYKHWRACVYVLNSVARRTQHRFAYFTIYQHRKCIRVMWSYYDPCEWIKQSGLMMTRPYISLCIVSECETKEKLAPSCPLTRKEMLECFGCASGKNPYFELALYVNLGYTMNENVWFFFLRWKKNAFNDKNCLTKAISRQPIFRCVLFFGGANHGKQTKEINRDIKRDEFFCAMFFFNTAGY